MEGVWVTAGWDLNWYGVVVHESAEEALKYLSEHGTDGQVVRFLRWGQELQR